MPATNRFLLISVLSILVVATGCGGSHRTLTGSINGPFNNSSLSGTYALSFTGVNTFGFLAVTASFQANGSGRITAGVADINSGNGVFTNQFVTGSYTIHNTGQGNATLNTNVGTFDLDFVMISNQHALVMRFDNNSTASGSMDLQSSSAFSLASITGPFAFNLFGIDATGNTLATVGAFTANSGGSITAGVEDFNDNGAPTTNLALSGSLGAPGGGNGRGIATLTTGSGARHFVFYIVNATHLKFIEFDVSPVLAGDAFSQSGPFSNASLSGLLAFTLTGSVGATPFARGGVMTTDGSGNIVSGTGDINNAGSVTQNLALTGSYAIAASGRGTATVNSSAGASNFVIYPSSGGLQMLQVDLGIVASGAALQQTGPFSNGSVQGAYGMNLSGVLAGGNEIDSIAQFTADGAGRLSGALDLNNAGVLTTNLSLSSNYTLAANGRGPAALQSAFGTQHIIFYAVSSTRVLFIEVDSDLVAVGELQHQ